MTFFCNFLFTTKDNTRILVINFPHNPTGFLPSEEEFSELTDICRKKKIFLFSDEMYRLTNNDGSSAYPSAAEVYGNAISLFGVSKTFGLPGLRIGWMASQNTGTGNVRSNQPVSKQQHNTVSRFLHITAFMFFRFIAEDRNIERLHNYVLLSTE